MSDRTKITRLTDELYLSGRIDEDDIPFLKSRHITHVINLNWPDQPEPQAIKDAFQHLDMSAYVETLDDGLPKPAWWFKEGINFAASMKKSGALLVHCGQGINRGPAMAYAILRDWGYLNAEEIVRSRPQVGTGKTGHWFDIYKQSADEARKV